MDFTVVIIIILFIIIISLIVVIILYATGKLGNSKSPHECIEDIRVDEKSVCQTGIPEIKIKKVAELEKRILNTGVIEQHCIRKQIDHNGYNVLSVAQFGYTHQKNSPFQTIPRNGFFGYPDTITNYGNAIVQVNPFTYRVNIKGVYLITVKEIFVYDHAFINKIGIAVAGVITHIDSTPLEMSNVSNVSDVSDVSDFDETPLNNTSNFTSDSRTLYSSILDSSTSDPDTLGNTLGGNQLVTGTYLLSLPTNQNINVVNPYSTQTTEVRSNPKINHSTLNDQSLLTFILLASL